MSIQIVLITWSGVSSAQAFSIFLLHCLLFTLFFYYFILLIFVIFKTKDEDGSLILLILWISISCITHIHFTLTWLNRIYELYLFLAHYFTWVFSWLVCVDHRYVQVDHSWMCHGQCLHDLQWFGLDESYWVINPIWEFYIIIILSQNCQRGGLLVH